MSFQEVKLQQQAAGTKKNRNIQQTTNIQTAAVLSSSSSVPSSSPPSPFVVTPTATNDSSSTTTTTTLPPSEALCGKSSLMFQTNLIPEKEATATVAGVSSSTVALGRGGGRSGYVTSNVDDDGDDDNVEDNDDDDDSGSWTNLSEIDSQYTRQNSFISSIAAQSLSIIVSDSEDDEGDDAGDDNGGDSAFLPPELMLPPRHDVPNTEFMPAGSSNNNTNNNNSTGTVTILPSPASDSVPSPNAYNSLQPGGDSTSELAGLQQPQLQQPPPPQQMSSSSHSSSSSSTSFSQERRELEEEHRQLLYEAQSEVITAQEHLRCVQEELDQLQHTHRRDVETLSGRLDTAEQELQWEQDQNQTNLRRMNDTIHTLEEQRHIDTKRLEELVHQTQDYQRTNEELTSKLEQLEDAKIQAEGSLTEATQRLTELQIEMDSLCKAHAVELECQEMELIAKLLVSPPPPPPPTKDTTTKTDDLSSSSLHSSSSLSSQRRKEVRFVEERNQVLEFELSDRMTELKASQDKVVTLEHQLEVKQNVLTTLQSEYETLKETSDKAAARHTEELSSVQTACSVAQQQVETATVERNQLEKQLEQMKQHETTLVGQLSDANDRSEEMKQKFQTSEEELQQLESQLALLQQSQSKEVQGQDGEEASISPSQLSKLRSDHKEELESLQQQHMGREWQLTEQIQDLQNRMERARRSNIECQRNIDIIYQESQRLQKELDLARNETVAVKDLHSKSELRVQQLQDRIVELESTIESLREDLMELHSTTEQDKVNAIRVEQEATQAALSKVRKLESETTALSLQITEVDDQRSVLQDQVNRLEADQMDRQTQHETELQTLRRTLDDNHKEASKANQQELIDVKKTYDDLKGRTVQLEEERDSLRSRLELAEQSRDELQSTLSQKNEEATTFDATIATLQGEVDDLRAKHSSVMQEHDETRLSLSQLLSTHEDLSKTSSERLQKAEQDLASVVTERETLQIEVEALKREQELSHEESKRLSDQVSSLDEALVNLQNEKQSIESTLPELQTQLQEVKADLTRSEQQVESMKVVHALALDNLLLERDDSLSKLNEARQSIEHLTAEWEHAKQSVDKLQDDLNRHVSEKEELLMTSESHENVSTTVDLRLQETILKLEATNDVVDQLQTEKQNLQCDLNVANDTISSLKVELSTASEQYNKLQEEHAVEMISKSVELHDAIQSAQALRLEKDQLEHQVSELFESKEKLEAKLHDVEVSSTKMRECFNKALQDLTATKTVLESTQVTVARLTSENDDLVRERDAVQTHLSEKQDAIRRQLEEANDRIATQQTRMDRKSLTVSLLEQFLSSTRDSEQSLQNDLLLEKEALVEKTSELSRFETIHEQALSDLESLRQTNAAISGQSENLSLKTDNELLEIQLDQAHAAIAELKRECANLSDGKDRSAHLEHDNSKLLKAASKQKKKIKNLSKILKKTMEDDVLSSMKHPVVSIEGTIAVPNDVKLGIDDMSTEDPLLERVKGMKMHVRLQYCDKTSGENCIKDVDARYTGPVLKSQPHGCGMLRFRGGDIFVCDFVHGAMNAETGSFVRRRKCKTSKS